MNEQPTIVLVRADDWVVLYVNGKKAAEGHSLSPAHVLDALGLVHTAQDAPRVSPWRGEVVFDDDLTRVRVELYEESAP